VAAGTEEGAQAPSSAREDLCQEPGCEQPRWTNNRLGAPPVIVSRYCVGHSHVRMFDAPARPPKLRPWRRKGEPRTFQDAVERRRLDRERVGRALGLLLQGRR
jgi:hypothetical protein